LLHNNSSNNNLLVVVVVVSATILGETEVEVEGEDTEEGGVVDPLTNPVRLILMT